MDYEKRKSYEVYGDANPPPYPGNSAELPTYQTPTFNNSTSNSRGLVSATARFPPTLNCYYQWTWKQIYYLGPSSDERMFAITFNKTIFSRKQSILLRNGPTDEAPVLATASRSVKGWNENAIITVNKPHGSGNDISFERPANTGWRKSEQRAFHYRTGKGHVEEFQWRTSHGNEIKELAGHSAGWKLVRMMGPETIGGSSKNPQLGFSSDGQEVVAVLAHSTSWSMTKGYKFAFMGTGLTGTLGEEWEAIAVITGFWMWWQQQMTAASTGATASAVAC